MSEELRIKAAEMALDLTKAIIANGSSQFLNGALSVVMKRLGNKQPEDKAGSLVDYYYHHFMELMSASQVGLGGTGSGESDKC